MSTKIEWVQNPDGTQGETWNPITGCTKVSTGCEHCYAERMARRLAGRFGYPKAPHHFDVTLHPDKLEQPLHWKKPRMVFVCSMGDLFHPTVPDKTIRRIWLTMGRTQRHTYLLLTKRPSRANEWITAHVGDEPVKILPNIWLGITAETQQAADERIPLLLETPAAKRWVSLEPMLGPVNITDRPYWDWRYTYDFYPRQMGIKRPLDLVVVGTESGFGRRPAKLEWMMDVVAQCKEANVPVFIKQVEINGRVSHDPKEWPESLRIRQMPTLDALKE